jgi:GGDEF domain-containing protein
MNASPDFPKEFPIQAALLESLEAGAMIVCVYNSADVLVFANVTFKNALGLAGITKLILHTVGRIGGEELLIILPGASIEEAWPAMEALRHGVADSRPKVPDGAEIHYTFSAGVAAMEPSDKVEGLLRRADAALYRARHAGRNRLERA